MVPTFSDVRAAASVLHGNAHRTPVLTSRTLDAQTGCRVYLKAENLQRIGAFKFRGAFNALRSIPQGTPVVAFSAGNHSQAVALAAQLQGRRAAIVMPQDSPRAKLEATRGYGAEVHTYDRFTEDREEITQQLADELGARIVPPYDDPDVVAGQGTAALELFEDEGPMDLLFVPVGGGGLLAGSLLAASEMAPTCRVIGIQPASGDHLSRSIEQGSPVEIPVPRTIADGVQTTRVGDLPFEIIRSSAATSTMATDAQLAEEMRFLATYLKTIVEPAGALGLAAARSLVQGLAPENETPRVGVILSGGNVDLERFAELVSPGAGSVQG
ncbi:MAG: pyridoxal-phosphate dependent enzyme [Nesterenkonia sp.]